MGNAHIEVSDPLITARAICVLIDPWFFDGESMADGIASAARSDFSASATGPFTRKGAHPASTLLIKWLGRVLGPVLLRKMQIAGNGQDVIPSYWIVT